MALGHAKIYSIAVQVNSPGSGSPWEGGFSKVTSGQSDLLLSDSSCAASLAQFGHGSQNPLAKKGHDPEAPGHFGTESTPPGGRA